MVGTLSSALSSTLSSTTTELGPQVLRHADEAAGACSVEVITDYEAFVALEAEWNETVLRAGVAHPFLSHEWLRTWWDCFGSGARLHILIVRDAGRIIAIAPLLSEMTRMYGIPIRRLGLLQNDHTPRADFIVAERPELAYRALWKALRSQCDQWDLLHLGQLPRESPTLKAFSDFARAEGLATGLWTHGISPYLELKGSWDDYFGGLGAKFRSNVRNRLSRLTQLGEPVLEVLEDAQGIQGAREESMRLEASGWKEQAGTAINSDPAVQRFYAMLADRATAHGWLRLLFLTVNGKRIATSYGSVYANRLFLFKTGYDPEFAKCSPFKILTYFAVKLSFQESLVEVDFLGDTEPWKLEWTSTTRTHDWLFVFSDTMRGRLAYRAKFQVAPMVRQWRR